MLIIGLTGMSGAGKTTVCDVFSENGVYVINCDILAREVVLAGTPCIKEIAQKFSEDYILPDGNLDRARMGALVFTDKEKRKLLNDTIYPYISYRVMKILNECRENGQEYVLLDAPTLFESKIDKICDVIVSVVADFKLNKERIMLRDKITEEMANNRLLSQQDKLFYIENSDYCIENNGSVYDLLKNARTVAASIIGEAGL